jgi:hypothetical protein
VSKLSRPSLSAAGTNSRLEALKVLLPDDLLCTRCAEITEWLIEEETTERKPQGRTEFEKWLFSGLTVDPAKLQAYYLSH